MNGLKMPNDEKKKPSKLSGYIKYRTASARATMIPYLFIAYPIAGLIIGWWLDSKFNSSPWWLLIFFFAGMVEAFREMVKIAKQVDKEYEEENKRKRGKV